MLTAIRTFMRTGHERSIKAKANIAASLVIRALSIIISLVMVPLTLNYLSASNYGIWLTLSSMIAWMAFFDIGFTQGLRNKLAGAMAEGKREVARQYISTTYCSLGLIFSAVCALLLIAIQSVNWDELIGTPGNMQTEVSRLASIIAVFFCVQFVFRIINTILIADQAPSVASLIDMLGQLMSLIIVFTLSQLTKGSLIYLGVAVGVSNLLVLLVASIVLFKGRYHDLFPSAHFIRWSQARDVLQLGSKFFVLQATYVLQFQTSLFMIAYYFDTQKVVSYNIAYKYFFTLQMLFTIFVSPLWSSVTDAYHRGDIAWIKSIVRKYLYLTIPFLALGLLMLLASDRIYDLWLGENRLPIRFEISLLICVFVCANIVGGIFVYVLNGISAIRIQFYSSMISSIAFIILTWILVQFVHLGEEAILISAIVCNAYAYVVAPLQYYMIFIKKSTTPIWRR